jgi:hypothetical protein
VRTLRHNSFFKVRDIRTKNPGSEPDTVDEGRPRKRNR